MTVPSSRQSSSRPSLRTAVWGSSVATDDAAAMRTPRAALKVRPPDDTVSRFSIGEEKSAWKDCDARFERLGITSPGLKVGQVQSMPFLVVTLAIVYILRWFSHLQSFLELNITTTLREIAKKLHNPDCPTCEPPCCYQQRGRCADARQ